jgi:hypothetical protein
MVPGVLVRKLDNPAAMQKLKGLIRKNDLTTAANPMVDLRQLLQYIKLDGQP